MSPSIKDVLVLHIFLINYHLLEKEAKVIDRLEDMLVVRYVHRCYWVSGIFLAQFCQGIEKKICAVAVPNIPKPAPSSNTASGDYKINHWTITKMESKNSVEF